MKDVILNNLTIKFESEIILDNINFTFKFGKRYVIRGNSGCGKTTLLNVIKGYYTPCNGEIVSNAKIEYLFQDELLFNNLTVRENMIIKHLAKDNSDIPKDDIFLEILKKLDIEDLLNKKIFCLSGGERQRVEIAIILLSDPDVVLLDEPTAKLDPDNKDNLINLVTNAFNNKTLLVVTHESDIFQDEHIKLRLQRGELVYEN